MKETPDILEQNVSTLLEQGGEPPRLADTARARMRAELVAKFGASDVSAAPRSRARTPVFAALVGVAAAIVLAVFAARWFRHTGGGATAPAHDGELADGSTFVPGPGGKVTVLGARHVRVDGEALLDVVPGKGTFTVETAHGRVEVLGTKFYVRGDSARTVAAVVRGQVKLASDTGEVLLHAGEQGIAEPGHPPTRGPAPRLSQLVSWAETARNQGAAEPLHHGTLFARDPGIRSHPPWGEEYPLPIAKLGLDVVIEDRVARVALDQTFHNDADQDLEGVYRFAIPPDAALQRLAMYVDGKLEESAVVERMQARRIYEELVYRRVDPALLEWAGSGRLSLRVYPLPARQDKRLVLAYTQSLPRLYSDWTLTVPMPDVDQPAGELDVRVRVKGCASCELTSTSHSVSVAKDGDDAIVTYRRALDKLGDSFVLHARDTRKTAIVASNHDGGERYVMVRAPIEIGSGQKPYRKHSWVIVDDVSASRGALELRAQHDVVDALLRELDEDDTVSVVAFDVEARTKLAPTRVRDVDRKAVRAALKDEGGVGATDFQVALDAALKLVDGDTTIVYLGDGVITAGPRELDALRARLAGKARFVGIGIGDGPDVQTLGALAGATGGYATTFDLADDLGWRAFDLVAALHTPRVTGVSARLVDASGALVPATAYLASPQLADGEEIEVVAKLAGEGTPAAVELDGSQDGAPWHRRIELVQGERAGAGYLPRLWAQRHIAARLLAKHEPVADGQSREVRDETIRKEVVALGKKYFLLSRHTSLLVLENDDMYARYGVTKGAGDTWASYPLPPTIPVVASRPSAAPPANVAANAELVRTPLQIFYDARSYLNYADRWQGDLDEAGGIGIGMGRFGTIGHGAGGGGIGTGNGYGIAEPMATRSALGFDGHAHVAKSEERAPDTAADATKAAGEDRQAQGPAMPFGGAERETITTAELTQAAGKAGFLGVMGARRGGAFANISGSYYAGTPTLARFLGPNDTAFDDVTAFVPALLPDDGDAWRARLVAAARASAGAAHTVDAAARAQLARARAALPSGHYRWGDREIVVDGARRIGWHAVTPGGLDETAVIDGRAFTRRYAELDLDVTRALDGDDVALALAYLPVWIAEPDHYARWFDVGARGAHEVVLSTRTQGHAKVAFVIAFDDRDHVVSISDGDGGKLVDVTWTASGPSAARVAGEAVAIGFTPEAIADAASWAQGTARTGVLVELPMHLASYWQPRIAKLAAGTPEWRHAERQLLASLAAVQDRNGLYVAFAQLQANGGIELGDVALASGGLAGGAIDAQLAAALAPVASEPLARYLLAGRAYGKQPRPEKLAVPAGVGDGLVAGLWHLRAAIGELTAAGYGYEEYGLGYMGHRSTGPARDHSLRALAELVAIGGRAPELRLIGVAALPSHPGMPADELVRAIDTLAVGPYANVVRGLVAQALWTRGDYDRATDVIADLVAKLDLRAAPAQLAVPAAYVQQSRRGMAGWQLIYAQLRDRVLGGDSFEHVLSLLPLAAQQQGGDVDRVLARAGELAVGDPRRRVEVARLAVGYGQTAFAQTIVAPLVQQAPSREVYQLAAQLALAQGKLADELSDLEAAQNAGGDERVDIATVRAELGQIIGVARQLALQSTGKDRERWVTRALGWGRRWRAIDPGNTAIDETLGDLLLALGDRAGAWRQLSSVIERDPWSGQGYTVVATAFEHEGKVADALPFWHQAVVIDQTNPTPRLREAQALIALGRTHEGDAILEDITHRKWHDAWSSVVYQAKALLDRGKR